MPAPTDVSQLRAFLGLINFYGNFVKDLHDLRAPLDALTKKDAVYKWTPENVMENPNRFLLSTQDFTN
ncbi:hypothetical protein COOONC_04058 [Cooperia oncophora]